MISERTGKDKDFRIGFPLYGVMEKTTKKRFIRAAKQLDEEQQARQWDEAHKKVSEASGRQLCLVGPHRNV